MNTFILGYLPDTDHLQWFLTLDDAEAFAKEYKIITAVNLEAAKAKYVEL